MSDRKMVVGLGNPGRRYSGTRHNIGFAVIDTLAEHLGIKVRRRRLDSGVGEVSFAGKKLILLKPRRYMNRSGGPVAKVMRYYGLEPSDLLVVVDDMALEPGRLRIRAQGSSGGHHGLADIIDRLGTSEFCRLRVGIGHSGGQEAVDFVLGRPGSAEKAQLAESVVRAREAVLCWVEQGIRTAMDRFN
jgi:PTH1 family peptidyl-tRNA hydrolase